MLLKVSESDYVRDYVAKAYLRLVMQTEQVMA